MPTRVLTTARFRGGRGVWTRLLARAPVLLLGGGCSMLNGMFGDKDPILPDEPADRLYNEGVYLLNEKKDFKESAKKFEEVDRQHPYSEWARKSLIMSAFAYYEAGSYDESVNAAKRYITLHPGSSDAAYAQYLIGASYFDPIPDVTRDQTRTERAIAALEEVTRKFPNTEYSDSARKKIEVARDQLAAKEMNVGRWYQEKKDFTGAINRFKGVVTRHRGPRHGGGARARLAECYMPLGIVLEAQPAAAVLGHNFPDSSWYKDAYRLGEGGGPGTQEKKGSLGKKGLQ